MSKDLMVKEDIRLRHWPCTVGTTWLSYTSLNVGRGKFVDFAMLRFKGLQPGHGFVGDWAFHLHARVKYSFDKTNDNGAWMFYTFSLLSGRRPTMIGRYSKSPGQNASFDTVYDERSKQYVQTCMHVDNHKTEISSSRSSHTTECRIKFYVPRRLKVWKTKRRLSNGLWTLIWCDRYRAWWRQQFRVIIFLVPFRLVSYFFRFVLCRDRPNKNRNYAHGSDGIGTNISNAFYRARKSTANDMRDEGTTTCRGILSFLCT